MASSQVNQKIKEVPFVLPLMVLVLRLLNYGPHSHVGLERSPPTAHLTFVDLVATLHRAWGHFPASVASYGGHVALAGHLACLVAVQNLEKREHYQKKKKKHSRGIRELN